MRVRAIAGALVLAGACSTVLGACGPSAGALGHQACVDVRHSIDLYHASTAATDPATRTRLATEATNELRRALRPAALAGSESGDWQALEITLSESNRVAEATLVPALEAQCAATLAG